jgi:tRNA (cytidine32/uridine32-2'-O)-methyltransferase
LSITSPLLDNIRIVLVEPQGALNVGSTCRAMKNFGLSHLSVVRPGCQLNLDAVKMAMHSTDILESARIMQTIPEAIEGSLLVLGTANRRGEYHEPNLTVQEGILKIRQVLEKGPVSILFGREEWGLTKEDLVHTMGTMRIVTDPECTSLNLSQAVLLIAYELYQNFGNPMPLPKACADDPYEQPPTTEELARLYNHIEAVLSMSEFLPLANSDAVLQILRAFFHRSTPTLREVSLLMGIFSNLRGFMRKYVKNPK